jgi:hypothetical protein
MGQTFDAIGCPRKFGVQLIIQDVDRSNEIAVPPQVIWELMDAED